MRLVLAMLLTTLLPVAAKDPPKQGYLKACQVDADCGRALECKPRPSKEPGKVCLWKEPKPKKR